MPLTFSMQKRTPFQRKFLWVGAFFLVMPSVAQADVKIECPAFDALLPISLNFSANIMTIKDSLGSTEMPATLDAGQPPVYTITGRGPMMSIMPDMAEFDKCLGEKLKEQGTDASDKNMLGYVSNVCRLKLLPSAKPLKADTTVTVISTDPQSAMVTVMATYPNASAVSGQPMELGDLLPRNCTVVSGP